MKLKQKIDRFLGIIADFIVIILLTMLLFYVVKTYIIPYEVGKTKLYLEYYNKTINE